MRADAAAADLLLVMGTTLRVPPVSELPALVRDGVLRVLVNREPLAGVGAGAGAGGAATARFDLELIGEADVVAELIERRAFGLFDGGNDGIVVDARDADAPQRLYVSRRR